MLSRKPHLPAELGPAWRAFLDCAEVIEGGRRVLLSALPVGRVEPAPIAVGVEALRAAVADATGWMGDWDIDAVRDEWQDCQSALAGTDHLLDVVLEVAAETGELEELLTVVQDVVEPLDVFADAERAWRRRWKIPRDRG